MYNFSASLAVTSSHVSTTSGHVSSNHTSSFPYHVINEDMCCIPGVERYVVPALFAVIVLFGCLGNGLVLAVVLKNRDYTRNTTSLFIVNLSIADLVFLVGCVPFHAIIYTLDQWPFGGVMCKTVHLIQYASMLASVFTLVAMAMDRYLAVKYPLKTKHLRTPRVALVWSAMVWLVALTISSPWPIVYSTRRFLLLYIYRCKVSWIYI